MASGIEFVGLSTISATCFNLMTVQSSTRWLAHRSYADQFQKHDFRRTSLARLRGWARANYSSGVFDCWQSSDTSLDISGVHASWCHCKNN